MITAQTDERMPHRDAQNNASSAKSIVHHSASKAEPVRINADDQTKWKLCCYPIVLIAIIILLSLVSSFTLPRSLIQINPNIWKRGNAIQICLNHLYLQNSVVKCSSTNTNYTTAGSYVSNLQPLNQFLVLYLSVSRQQQQRNINLNQNVNFELYSSTTSNGSIIVTNLIFSKTLSLVGQLKQVFDDGKLFIIYMSKLSYSDEFYWQLQFANNSQLTPPNYTLQSQVVNPQFSLFTIILRVTLFALSLVAFLRFNYAIFKIPKDKVSVQQRLIQVLSVVTLTFNDQLYFVSVIYPNPFSSFLSAFFLWNFVVSLFIIWAVFLNRIIKNQPETQTEQFTPPRAAVSSFFYLIILAYSVLYAITQTTEHPVFSEEDTRSHSVIALAVFAALAFIIACIYIFYLFICACKDNTNRLYRHNIFLAFTITFFISTIVFFFTGGYNLFNYSASKILFTLCFMNMYSFYLQYFYSPTSEQIKKFERLAKQPLRRPQAEPQELIQIPQSGQVQIYLIQTSQKSQKISEAQNNERESQISRQQQSLSARQRRRRNRRKKGTKQSYKIENEKGQSNSQIISDQAQVQIQNDQFN